MTREATGISVPGGGHAHRGRHAGEREGTPRRQPPAADPRSGPPSSPGGERSRPSGAADCDRPNLLGLPPARLDDLLSRHFRARGQPAYRVRQAAEWVFRGDARHAGEMTNLPAAERDALGEAFRLDEPALAESAESADGTAKHLWRLRCGDVVESVLIPAGRRLTLCISSQAGCALACRFCATGWSGFGRQLSAGEIVGQHRGAARWARERGLGDVTNIVFMGMGEPMANRAAVFPALTILNAGYGIGARRVTVSTVGLVPGILALAEREEQFRLAVSLHAPVSSLRAELVPVEKRWPLDELMEALDVFRRKGGRRITFEYAMIRDVNDEKGLAEELAKLALRAEAFVNLIPFNPIPYVDWRPSRPARVRAFLAALKARGVAAAVREPRGRDIDAACGQLRAAAGARRAGAVSGPGCRSGSPGSP